MCSVNLSESENPASDNVDDNSDDIKLTIKEVAQKIDESVHVFRTGIEELKNHILTLQREVDAIIWINRLYHSYY